MKPSKVAPKKCLCLQRVTYEWMGLESRPTGIVNQSVYAKMLRGHTLVSFGDGLVALDIDLDGLDRAGGNHFVFRCLGRVLRFREITPGQQDVIWSIRSKQGFHSFVPDAGVAA